MRLKRFLSAVLFSFSALLVFLFIVEDRIVLPAWLQVVGRMHPLFLHLPIVLLVVNCIWFLFIPKKAFPKQLQQEIGDWLLLNAALAAVVTALMGLFLAREASYDADAMVW
ncbi:MAG: peptidylprolyl isomerase, partial [Chitinophagaceae bacterium]|nr:peptidylprolyl isomerase [Chitinophagaceae bacterium]